jgi:uncharacterized membrane protein
MALRAPLVSLAVHPLLIASPLALLAIAVGFDVLGIVTGAPGWGSLAFWNLVAGVLVGAGASVHGLVQLVAVPSGLRVARTTFVIALLRMLGLGLAGVSLGARTFAEAPLPNRFAIICSAAALALALAASWLRPPR